MGPGEEATFRIEPPLPESLYVSWSATDGVRSESVPSPYRAPYIIPATMQRLTLTAKIYGHVFETKASLVIDLNAGSWPGAETCLGPSQAFPSFSSGPLAYVYVDELPEAIYHPQPNDPRSPHERSQSIPVLVKALVCRTGEVIDAIFIPLAGKDLNGRNKIQEAAVTAVLQWRFKPAMSAGQPVAVMVDVPLRFGP